MASARGSSASTIRISRPSHSPFTQLQSRTLIVLGSIVVLGTLYSVVTFSAAETAFRTRFPSSVQARVENEYGFIPSTVDSPYFSQKRNIFNQWFVKKAWGWTTLVAALHLAANVLAAFGIRSADQVVEKAKQVTGQGSANSAKATSSSLSAGSTQPQPRSATSSPAPKFSSTSPQADVQSTANTIARISAKPILRWLLATSYWLLFTRWFFGPSFSERVLVLTGGECIPSASPSGVSKSIDAALCRVGATATLGQAGGAIGAESMLHPRPYWKGGHDVSGHVFLLVHATVYLVSAVGPVLPYLFGNPQESPLAKRGEVARKPTALQRGTAWAVLAMAGLWTWMLLMTSIYFHTPLEKLSGGLVALAGVAVQAIAN